MGIIFLTCSGRREAGPSARKEMGESRPETKPVRLDSYSFKGFVFTYYLIPPGISREELIAAARLLDRPPLGVAVEDVFESVG